MKTLANIGVRHLSKNPDVLLFLEIPDLGNFICDRKHYIKNHCTKNTPEMNVSERDMIPVKFLSKSDFFFIFYKIFGKSQKKSRFFLDFRQRWAGVL